MYLLHLLLLGDLRVCGVVLINVVVVASFANAGGAVARIVFSVRRVAGGGVVNIFNCRIVGVLLVVSVIGRLCSIGGCVVDGSGGRFFLVGRVHRGK